MRVKRFRLALTALVLAGAAIGACSGGSGDETADSTPPSTAAAPSEPEGGAPTAPITDAEDRVAPGDRTTQDGFEVELASAEPVEEPGGAAAIRATVVLANEEGPGGRATSPSDWKLFGADGTYLDADVTSPDYPNIVDKGAEVSATITFVLPEAPSAPPAFVVFDPDFGADPNERAIWTIDG